MKIIQICASYKPAYTYGGPIMSVSKLSEELSKSGVELEVLTTTANGKSELDVATNKVQIVDGVKVHYFKRWTKDHTHFSPALFWFLYKTIRNEKRSQHKSKIENRHTPNLIIHIHAWWNLVSIFSCWIAKKHGIKVVLSPRGMINDYTLNNRNSISKKWIHQVIGKKLLNYCLIHSTSNIESIDIFKLLNITSIQISNFVNLLTYSPKKQSNEYYKICYLGRINEIKKIENLLLALSKIKIEWKLSIAGEGSVQYINQLKELTKENNINKKIEWLGFLNNDSKNKLLSNSDILILTSEKENFANVVIESLSVGTPVLISNNVGLADYVMEKNLGWVSENTPDELAKTITQSFYEIEKRKTIQQTAPQIIRKDFDEKYLVEKYLELYNYLITKYVRI